jgi:hypothetical protein
MQYFNVFDLFPLFPRTNSQPLSIPFGKHCDDETRCETEEEEGNNDVFLGIFFARRPSKYLIDWVTLKGSPVSGCPTIIICFSLASLPTQDSTTTTTTKQHTATTNTSLKFCI